MFTKQTVDDIDLEGKTVLLRADYNVPIENGEITDDYRIKQSLPTIQYLLGKNVKLIICSHLGRPDGKPDKSFSLKPIAARLSKLIDRPVAFAEDCIGVAAKTAKEKLENGQILLLENLRFHPEEEANDSRFAGELAEQADVFVQDGFGVVHRAHASTEAITHLLSSVAGRLLFKEVDTITNVMDNPAKPLLALVGGAKIADKIEVLNRLIEIADFIAIGGAMANTFLSAEGFDVGASLYDKDQLDLAKQIIESSEAEAKKRPFVLALPQDVVVASSTEKTAKTRIVEYTSHSLSDVMSYPSSPELSWSKIEASEMILDIGPITAAFYGGAIQFAKTVIWNGTMGVTETPSLNGAVGPFAQGTETVVEALLGDLGNKPDTVVGGGDTVGYVESRGLVDSFHLVSTGGGASLELMSGHKLPGVEALLDKK